MPRKGTRTDVETLVNMEQPEILLKKILIASEIMIGDWVVLDKDESDPAS